MCNGCIKKFQMKHNDQTPTNGHHYLRPNFAHWGEQQSSKDTSFLTLVDDFEIAKQLIVEEDLFILTANKKNINEKFVNSQNLLENKKELENLQKNKEGKVKIKAVIKFQYGSTNLGADGLNNG